MTFAAKSFASFLAVWIIINSIVLRMRPFDPYPFILLNQLLSCLAAIQAPVIMMSQNRQEAKDRVRAEHDYRVNLKAELDISKGRRNKFELDKATGLLKLDRCLYSSSHIPGDYGYVPQTLAEGGDAPDVLVMVNEPTFTGCLIKARVVGLFRMTDRRSNDYKVLSVLEGRPLNRRARRTARRRCTKLRRQLRGSATRPDRRAINDHGRTASRARPCIPFSRRNRYRNAGHAEHVESTDDLWWKFAFHGNVPRSLRALTGAATVVFAVTLVRLFRAQPPTPGLPTAEEVDCGRTIVAAHVGQSRLARRQALSVQRRPIGAGDVRHRGPEWVSMGDPVGPRAAADALAQDFRESGFLFAGLHPPLSNRLDPACRPHRRV